MGTLKRIINSKQVTWLSRSPLGNIVFSGIVLGLPTFLVFSYKSYEEGMLSPDRVAYLLFVSTLESVALGLFIWIGVAKPAMDRKSKS
jgi:hypothetical protein